MDAPADFHPSVLPLPPFKNTLGPSWCTFMFVASVLTVVLQRFSDNTVILAELVRLKEPPPSMGPESAIDYVR